jgi:allantoicase
MTINNFSKALIGAASLAMISSSVIAGIKKKSIPQQKIPLNAMLLSYSNSDFTNPHEVVLADEPENRKGKFSHMGAQYSGYESDRHKATTVNNDHSLRYNHDAHNDLQIALKQRTNIDTINISTQYFTGNQVQAVSVTLKDELTGKETKVLDREPLKPDTKHSFNIPNTIATEAKIDAYYEGGISRIHFFGDKTNEQLPERKNLLEDAEISHVSNQHYGNPQMAVQGNRKENYMVGWESARTGFGEKAVFSFDTPKKLSEVVVDTYMHRLNAPLTAHLFGANLKPNQTLDDIMPEAPTWKIQFSDGKEVIPKDFQKYMLNQEYLKEDTKNPKQFNIKLNVPENSSWKPLLPFEQLKPDTYHRFNNIQTQEPVIHLLYMHYPNGGIHGLKVFE